MATKKINKLVPDTSAVINQIISTTLEKKELAVKEILIHIALMSELENQANQNKEIGFLGLAEIQRFKELEDAKKIKLSFSGKRPTIEEIKFAKRGSIDSMIRQLAEKNGATLITSDLVQGEVGKAMGLDVIHIPSEVKEKKFLFLKYFKPNYMSVHLKEGEPPRAKKGEPGDWKFVEISKTKIGKDELEKITEQIVESARMLEGCFLEIERKGSIIAQLQDFRIVVTRPPLSDAWEITLVRPIKKLKFTDYNLSALLKARLRKGAEGILIAGAPGHGKSTFAQSLAREYAELNKVVKALESPRDMQLPKSVTQYAYSKSSHAEIKDILLLTRPDYTVFDEVRNTGDFSLYADMRLSGVGMIGVVHATNPIDSIQRFIGRIELGMIPSIVDTVIFIKDGEVKKVYGLKMHVKVPSGMTESDLARPIVDIFDFDSGRLEYEIYTYGDATVVMPIEEIKAAQEREEKRELRYRLRETNRYFEFIFFTPRKAVDIIINGVLVSHLPLQKGRSLKVFKKSQLGKEIITALRTRGELRFE